MLRQGGVGACQGRGEALLACAGLEIQAAETVFRVQTVFRVGAGAIRALHALDLGFYISFSGIMTFRNAEPLRDVVRKVPLDRLLIETDSPYLAPVPYRGKTNQPAYVAAVAAAVAELKQVSIEELASQTSDNFRRLFPLARC